MAKDGTARGGARPGSGPKKKPLVTKIVEGKIDIPEGNILPEPVSFEGADVPPIKEYLRAEQKNGKDLCAEDIFKETWLWLKARGCENIVSTQLI